MSAVDGGVPMAMASKMVRHEDIRTTQAHYYTLSADRRRLLGRGYQFRLCQLHQGWDMAPRLSKN